VALPVPSACRVAFLVMILTGGIRVSFLSNEGEMSRQLIARSFALLRRDPKLLLLPIFSVFAGAAILALFYLSPMGESVFGASPSRGFNFADAGPLLLAYWLLYFVIVFFNCALAACAHARFAGREMSLRDGLAQAMSRVREIIIWSLLSSTLGVLVRVIECGRVHWLGRLAVRIFAAAWDFATFLVIPVLMIEDLGLIESVLRSGSLVGKAWGEQSTVGFGIGWISVILSVPGLILGTVGVNYYPVVLVAAVLYFVTLTAVMMSVRRIFDVALYRYATSGHADGFPPGMLNGAFGVRSRR